jgi:hypothetical protein
MEGYSNSRRRADLQSNSYETRMPLEDAKREEVELKARYDFLIATYKAMWDNINRHVTVLWQAAGVLGTAFGATLLAKQGSAAGLPQSANDVASALVIAAAFWLISHAFDVGNWYNRNIQIISGIEHIFLRTLPPADQIHPYAAASWTRDNKLITHVRIQLVLGAIIGTAAYVLHTISRVIPDFCFGCPAEPAKWLPTIAMAGGVIAASIVYCSARHNFAKFKRDLDAVRKGDHAGSSSPPILSAGPPSSARAADGMSRKESARPAASESESNE